MKVVPAAFGHRGGMSSGVGDIASSMHHLDHLPLRPPHREGADRARRAHRGQGKTGARMVPDQPFDRLAPRRNLDSWGSFILASVTATTGSSGPDRWAAGRRSGNAAQTAPLAQELQPDMPAARQLSTELAAVQERLQSDLVVPLGEHRQPAQLHPGRGHRRRSQSHDRKTFGVSQPGYRCPRRCRQQRPDDDPGSRRRQMETVDAHRVDGTSWSPACRRSFVGCANRLRRSGPRSQLSLQAERCQLRWTPAVENQRYDVPGRPWRQGQTEHPVPGGDVQAVVSWHRSDQRQAVRCRRAHPGLRGHAPGLGTPAVEVRHGPAQHPGDPSRPGGAARSAQVEPGRDPNAGGERSHGDARLDQLDRHPRRLLAGRAGGRVPGCRQQRKAYAERCEQVPAPGARAAQHPLGVDRAGVGLDPPARAAAGGPRRARSGRRQR